MVEITGEYSGNLKMELTHGPSGTSIRSAAPKDNQGDGSSFSPTDLVATALGSCAVTTMAIVAQREGIPFDGASFHVEKHMNPSPRRIGRLPLRIRVQGDASAEQRARLEEIAHTCPVARSLHPDVAVEMQFEYDG